MSMRDEALTRLAFEAGYRAARADDVTAAEIDQAWRRHMIAVFVPPEPVKRRRLFRARNRLLPVQQSLAHDAPDLSDTFEFCDLGEAA